MGLAPPGAVPHIRTCFFAQAFHQRKLCYVSAHPISKQPARPPSGGLRAASQRGDMKDFGKLSDRLENQAKARQAMLEKLKALPGPNDPEMIALREKQKEVAEAREARKIERQLTKEREAREQAEREAAAAAEAVARAQREAEEQAVRLAAIAAEKKAARDAAYAARKKRNKK